MSETNAPPASLLPSPYSFPSNILASKGSLVYAALGFTVS